MEDIGLTRKELLALLNDLGGHGNLPADADDGYLAAIVTSKLALVTDIASIERALAKPMPMTWRGRLTARKIELERAAQAVRDAERGGTPRKGNLVVTVPDSVGLSHYQGKTGRVAMARVEDGRVVIDLFADEFKSLLTDRKFGRDWHDANTALLAQIAEAA